MYRTSFTKGFQHFYGEIENFTILALLPNYLEQEGSSLVYMVNELIEKSGSEESGFYLHNLNIRPLILPVGKGILGTKNVFINYLENNDRFSETEINSIFGNKLFPYNSFIKNKFI